ncbi:hypothetical protein OEZ85_006560 [Tetradesmus obliquus]|uniref:Secreted protein n=1 Tax=Tetradesmus obliquus TaxID=3088 RepID=A0ABY8TV41_TETOB|nr:hypothetical protein OEZ85_006560 [Tetradesmus obliquus]
MAMQHNKLICVALLCVLSAALPTHSARLLHSRTGWDDSSDDQGDASGYSSSSAARVINPASTPTPASRTAVTPLSIAAEATSNAVFTGAHRLVAPQQRRSYATVEPDPVTNNNDRRQVTILPRQRSVQDLPAPRNILAGGSGNDNMPALVMGGMAHSQTYEGATSISATDAVAANKGGKFTPVAYNNLISRPGVWKQGVQKRKTWGTARGSWGLSNSQAVGSLAVSGISNGVITLAQADSAVAMSQTEKSSGPNRQSLDN